VGTAPSSPSSVGGASSLSSAEASACLNRTGFQPVFPGQ
jgi:hypothetical protein